jgi:hypothetical protein
MFSLLIVALSLNILPFLPFAGSGLFGLVLELLLEKEEPFLPEAEALFEIAFDFL